LDTSILFLDLNAMADNFPVFAALRKTFGIGSRKKACL